MDMDDPDHKFIEGLRSYSQVKVRQLQLLISLFINWSLFFSQHAEAPRVTKPVPFKLTVSKKKSNQTVLANPSMAEGVQKWEKKTPERFHSSRHGEVYRMIEVSYWILVMLTKRTNNEYYDKNRKLKCVQRRRTHLNLWLWSAIALYMH